MSARLEATCGVTVEQRQAVHHSDNGSNQSQIGSGPTIQGQIRKWMVQFVDNIGNCKSVMSRVVHEGAMAGL
jgi:hypothetical protein